MNFQKIVKIITLVLGVLGLLFLFTIFDNDDEIKAAAAAGDYSKISPLIHLAILVLEITIVSAVLFSLIGLFSNKEKLKKSLYSIIALLIVLGIAYGISEGVETPMKDGEVLSASGSRWVETGIRMFYILVVIAIGSMVISSVKKIIK